jgi:squalene-hopene/tetraprenyl-beta-curcumene cyclase
MRFACLCPIAFFIACGTAAGEPPRAVPAARTDEPVAKAFSLAKAADVLDTVTLSWVRKNQCFSCHTGYPYLLARTSLGDADALGLREARKFLEERVAAWDKGGKGKGYLKGEGIIELSEGVTEVVAVAATLALHDGQTAGKLQPATRTALARMWELQQADGSWNWNKEDLAPLEYDDYFGAVYAAIGVGHAPEGYARSEAARKGVARLLRYFEKTPAPNLHHKTYLLWASLGLDGLMDNAERDRTVKALLSLQREDGGWSLPSLGAWKRLDGQPQDENAPSDGYATGLVLYVLRQAGVAATENSVRRGVNWLKTHQRESGRWFTRSLNREGSHYISNAGTAFAIMALRACE